MYYVAIASFCTTCLIPKKTCAIVVLPTYSVTAVSSGQGSYGAHMVPEMCVRMKILIPILEHPIMLLPSLVGEISLLVPFSLSEAAN